MPASKPSARAMAQFEKEFGKAFGADRLQRAPKVVAYSTTGTGSLVLDYATGVGGLVEGRVNEIWGPEGVGKTTMVGHMIREYQKAHPNRMVGFIDMEQKLDKGYFYDIGVDPDLFYYYLPDSAEEVADALQKMAQREQAPGEPLIGMMCVDSIGGMGATAAAFETEAEKDTRIGRQASIVTRMVQTMAVRARQRRQTLLLVNQVRANVSGFGKANTTGGGWALRHVTTMKFECKRTGTPPVMLGKDEDRRQVQFEMAVFVERNNVAPPRRTAIIKVNNEATEKYGPVGVDRAQEAFNLGKRLGFIAQRGAWYDTPDGEQNNGEAATVEHLRRNPDLIEDLRKKIIETRSEEVVPEEIAEPVGDEPEDSDE